VGFGHNHKSHEDVALLMRWCTHCGKWN